jgi:hypothetical protein
MNNIDKPEVILHGECMVFHAEIPDDAQPITVAGDHLVVADSETTGNHHVVDFRPGVEFLEKEGRRFMRNSVPTNIRCVHAARHDAITLEPGCWEFGTQQEYDPFAENMRNVRD